MPKARLYRMDIGHQTLVGPLTKLQAIQRALNGVHIVQLRGIDRGNVRDEYVYVLPDERDEQRVSVATLERRVLTAPQYRMECTPRITQQPLGQETL